MTDKHVSHAHTTPLKQTLRPQSINHMCATHRPVAVKNFAARAEAAANHRMLYAHRTGGRGRTCKKSRTSTSSVLAAFTFRHACLLA
jgi:hypothetical protein